MRADRLQLPSSRLRQETILSQLCRVVPRPQTRAGWRIRRQRQMRLVEATKHATCGWRRNKATGPAAGLLQPASWSGAATAAGALPSVASKHGRLLAVPDTPKLPTTGNIARQFQFSSVGLWNCDTGPCGGSDDAQAAGASSGGCCGRQPRPVRDWISLLGRFRTACNCPVSLEPQFSRSAGDNRAPMLLLVQHRFEDTTWASTARCAMYTIFGDHWLPEVRHNCACCLAV